MNHFRIICYLDILGFSNKILAYSIDEKKDIYNALIQKMKIGGLKYHDFYDSLERNNPKRNLIARSAIKNTFVSWFSDTVIVYSSPFDQRNPPHDPFKYDEINSLVRRSNKIFLEFLKKGFPVRGAIAVGPFYDDRRKNIYVGQALIEAYQFSQSHDWSGITLTDKCSLYLSQYGIEVEGITKYKVPMKQGEVVKLDVINWVDSLPKSWKKDFKKKITYCFNAHYQIEDWAALRKLDNTLKFCKSILNTKKHGD